VNERVRAALALVTRCGDPVFAGGATTGAGGGRVPEPRGWRLERAARAVIDVRASRRAIGGCGDGARHCAHVVLSGAGPLRGKTTSVETRQEAAATDRRVMAR
jgi:hypothetical protein